MTVSVLVFSKGCMGLLYSKECNMNDHLIAPPSMGIKCHISLVLNLPELAIFRRNASNIHSSHFSACSMPKSTTIIQRNNSSYMQSPNFSFFFSNSCSYGKTVQFHFILPKEHAFEKNVDVFSIPYVELHVP